MKILFSLFICLIITSGATMAQDNYGYYGKKTFLDISSSSYIPLFYNLTFGRSGYKLSSSGNSLVEDKKWLNVGLRASVGRALSSKVGIAFEFGWDQYKIYANLFSDYDAGVYVDRSESVRVNSFLFMPRLEFSGPNGLLPNGLVHQVGIGVNLNSAVTRNYLRDYGSYTAGGPTADPAEAEQLMIDHGLDESVKMVQLMYGLKMRTPIGKSLLINYGFRYTLDFGGGEDYYGYDSYYDFSSDVRRYQFRNLIAFDLGVTLAF